MFRFVYTLLSVLFLIFTLDLLCNSLLYNGNLSPVSSFDLSSDIKANEKPPEEELSPWEWLIFQAEKEEEAKKKKLQPVISRTKSGSEEEQLEMPQTTDLSESEIQQIEAWTHFINNMEHLSSNPSPQPVALQNKKPQTARELMEELGLSMEELLEMQTTFAATLYIELEKEEENFYGLLALETWRAIQSNDEQPEPAPFETTPRSTSDFEFTPEDPAWESYQALLDAMIDAELTALQSTQTSI